MAVPTNTLQTYQSTNNAEDVSDIINMVSPFDTPLFSMAKKTTAEATYTEWLIDSLEALDTANANIEGAADFFPVVRFSIIHVVHLS